MKIVLYVLHYNIESLRKFEIKTEIECMSMNQNDYMDTKILYFELHLLVVRTFCQTNLFSTNRAK